MDQQPAETTTDGPSEARIIGDLVRLVGSLTEEYVTTVGNLIEHIPEDRREEIAQHIGEFTADAQARLNEILDAAANPA